MTSDRQAADAVPQDTAERRLGTRGLTVWWTVLSLWLVVFAARLVIASLHWPLVHDAPILIYMGFLSEHGLRLYRDVVEVQFPGAVLLYQVGRHLFGTSDLGFRIFDLAGLAVATLAALAIARTRGLWFAGVFGSAFFLWSHAGVSTAIGDLGQRDFFMTCGIAAGVACLLEAMRRARPWWLVGFGFAVAYAASIKPPAILFLLPLASVVLEVRSRGERVARYVIATAVGIAAAVALVAGYLLADHALGAFLAVERRMVPLYTAIAGKGFRESLPVLLAPGHLLPLLAAVCILLVLLERGLRHDREQQVLALCTLLGAATYLVQHKGFVYHRSPFIYFFFLWAGWVLVRTVRQGGRWLSWGALVLITLTALGIVHLRQAVGWDLWDVNQMQSDLNRLHAADRPGELQCLDVVDGCLTVALRMQAVMATGYIQDYLMFLPPAPGNPARNARFDTLRADFLTRLEQARPQYVLISNDQWPWTERRGYDRLEHWPAFAGYLNSDYRLLLERGGDAVHQRGYRIYEHR